jgi:type II secretory pathway pseudopilin PulG
MLKPLSAPTARRDEGGFSVVELAITLLISMTVMASLLGMLTSQTSAEKRVQEVADSQEAIRLAYVELTSDLRSADPIVSGTASSVEVDLQPVSGGAVRHVRWSVENGTLGGRELVRTELGSGGSNAVSYRLPGLATDQVFTFYKAGTTPVTVPTADVRACAKRVHVVLLATAEGKGAPLRLESDVDLRNASVSASC